MIETTVFSGEIEVWKGSKSEKAWCQVVAYVDDLLLFAPTKEHAMFIKDHLAAKLKVKITGFIDKSSKGGGELRFLGRNVKREAHESCILVGLDENYLDKMFEAYGITTTSQAPPDLRSVLEGERNDELSMESTLRFRAALGKISWMSQTYVFLNIYTALLATGMAKPLDKRERAMRLLLRFLKSQVGVLQRFPSLDAPDREVDAVKLIIYCDASWAPMSFLNRRSITGACFFYRGSVIKAFSRLQQVVALSSCEAELSALAEAIQESMGMKRISEHLFLETHCQVTNAYETFKATETLQGLMNHLLFRIVEEDNAEADLAIEIEIRTDSQAAVRVLSSAGLQRRSRRVELRICFCQEFVKSRTVTLVWVEGSQQIADILTKCLGSKLYFEFRSEMGFLENHELHVPESGSKPMKAEGGSSQKGSPAKSSPAGQPKLKSTPKKKGSLMFLGERPSASQVMDLEQSQSSVLLPRPCFMILESFEHLDHVRADDFNLLFIEVCCDVGSNLAEAIQASEVLRTAIVRVTDRQGGFEKWCHKIVLAIRKFKACDKKVFVHMSLPCTGGSYLQNFSKNPDRIQQLEAQFKDLLRCALTVADQADEFLFELPKRNRYWSSVELVDFFKQLNRKLFFAFPRLCQLGVNVSKVYGLISNSETLVKAFRAFEDCNHESHTPFNQISWKETGSYTATFCKIYLRALEQWYEFSGEVSADQTERIAYAPGDERVKFKWSWRHVNFIERLCVFHLICG